MTAEELIEELTQLLTIHEEARTAQIWAKGDGYAYPVKFIGWDKRHKPARIRLDEV